MSVYALTPLVQADIFDIWCYIANDSEDAANRVEQAIYDACELVAEAPKRCHSRPDLTSRSLRFWTLTRYPNYNVVYRAYCLPFPAFDRRSAPVRPQYDTSSSLRGLFLVDAPPFGQHVLVKYARYQDAARFDPIKHHMPGMFHAAQAGPDMIAAAA